MELKVVLDTCVFVSALRSRRGASFRVVQLIGKGRFQTCVSVPLVLEYESVGKRIARSVGLRHSDVDDIVDYICRVSERRQIFYLWRPFLKDPMDDMVLELAVESGAQIIVTHNIRDFQGVEEFGLRAIPPGRFLREIGELP
ncbi:MAG: putative toxin-antitoxin system toxin component, PIN family [Candidatus Eisenbacteria sp.]|nr:putative toxin-antitoxin system toxin component, PIN family [Candidatus Eisenbacteria bacterium]